eukprot:TRINITY_DN3110_c1_g1_i2.p1 TRINITY_DN3110_c1_g1~~TRINITY_DN3110_c1_g1_i2.p1  ORF type:complete len:486 (+),score=177.72 TRINITY_DN3110_c1_g1_i2:45-1502(+)
MTAVVVRRRIRPPGCCDERHYGWRTFKFASEEEANACPSPPAAAPAAKPPAEDGGGGLHTGAYEEEAAVAYDGVQVVVRRADAAVGGWPIDPLLAEVAWEEAGASPWDVLQRACFPGDTVVDDAGAPVAKIERVNRNCSFTSPREQTLLREVAPPAPAGHALACGGGGDAGGGAGTYVMTHRMEGGRAAAREKERGAAFFEQRAELAVEQGAGGALRFSLKLYQCNVTGAMPIEMDMKYGVDALARTAHRVSTGTCVQDGVLGAQCREMNLLPSFVHETDEDNDAYVKVKDVWSAPLKGYITLKKRVDPKTPYPAYKGTAEIDGNVLDFIALLDRIKEPGDIKKCLTPECEEQGIHVEDVSARIVYKIDKIGPWPLKKREFLGISTLGWGDDGTCYFVTRSIEDKRFPTRSGNQRAFFHNLGYKCQPAGTPGKVRLTQLVHVDPVGIPKGAYELVMGEKVKNLGYICDFLREAHKWRPTKPARLM